MPTILETNEHCKDCVTRRCRLHHVQSQVLRKLYHDAEDEWRRVANPACPGLQAYPSWNDRATFSEAHRYLSIALCVRGFHHAVFFPEPDGYIDDGHKLARQQLWQMRRFYEDEAGMNDRAFLRVTSDREVAEIVYAALKEQVTPDTINDEDFDYVLRIPHFETYEEVSPGTTNSIHRGRPPPPKPVDPINWL